MKKFLLLRILLLFFLYLEFNKAAADEGMWLPFLLSETVEAEMKRLGMRINADEIYSINKPSLKDAVVLFGRGCTGVIVSENGLLLTNHHCAIGRIQAHSSVENDYLKNGFWAKNFNEELPNPGLEVRLVVSMHDVTDKILDNIPNNADLQTKQIHIQSNISNLIKETTKNNHYEARVLPFFYGNQYILVLYEVFRDIRLVGAPPEFIGNFGGDTDNWMWPRYSGDFAWFRIYADKDNKPATFSKENVPYKPRAYATISLKGFQENDFVFILGFPGRTSKYTTSHEIEMIRNQKNPVCINIRRNKLDVIEKYMNLNDTNRIKYSSRRSSIANHWKKMIGENIGIDRFDVINQKKQFEKSLVSWVKENNQIEQNYHNLFDKIDSLYKIYSPIYVTNEILLESALDIDIIKAAVQFYRLWELISNANTLTTDIKNELEKISNWIKNTYRNINLQLDKEIFLRLLPFMLDFPSHYQLAYLKDITQRFKSHSDFVDFVYQKSIFSSPHHLQKFIESFNLKKSKKILSADPIFKIALDIIALSIHLNEKLDSLKNIRHELLSSYYKLLTLYQPNKTFWPDANHTLRVSYGIISSTKPFDAITYRYFTTTQGILERYLSGHHDYFISDEFKSFLQKERTSRYAHYDGTVCVAFITNCHTSGGNSGSPVFDRDGHLIGLNFDRAWEGVMSDYFYESTISRNISVDIRYVLFITEQFAKNTHIIRDLIIVQ